MGCAIAAELAGLVSEFGLVVLVLRAVRTVTGRLVGWVDALAMAEVRHTPNQSRMSKRA
jgi:hypothetical protein